MHNILLENDTPLSDEHMNIDDAEFKHIERKEQIFDAELKSESTSYNKDVWMRFIRSKVSIVSAVLVFLIILLSIFGPYLNNLTVTEQRWDLGRLPPRVQGLSRLGIMDGTGVRDIQVANLPNWEHAIVEIISEFYHVGRLGNTPMLQVRVNEYLHAAHVHRANIENGITPDPTYLFFWFGSDALGRCLFLRLWQGTRVSLLLGFAVFLVNISIGLIIGAMLGYYGGKFDMIMQRIMECLVNIPFLPMAIVLIMFLGSGLRSLIILFLIQGWIPVANNVRIQFYRFKNREYVLASRTMGATDKRVMFKHILPNAIGTTITFMALMIPHAILTEAFLAYLGLGIEAPNPSIGVLLRNGQENLLSYPFMLFYPAIVIVTLMLAFNLMGNGLRDAFNPSLRK